MFKSTVIKVESFTYEKNGHTYEGKTVWFSSPSGLPMKNWLDPCSTLKEGDSCSVTLEPDRYCNARVVVK